MLWKGTWEHCEDARLYVGIKVSQSVALTSQHSCTAKGHPVIQVQRKDLRCCSLACHFHTWQQEWFAKPLWHGPHAWGMLRCPLCRGQGQEACPRVAVIHIANARDGEMLRYPWAVWVYDWIPFFSQCCFLMPQRHFAPGLFYWRAEEQQKETIDHMVDAARYAPGFMAACTHFQHAVMLKPCLKASTPLFRAQKVEFL